MTAPTRPKQPHWLLYTIQFKDPAAERAKAVYAGKPNLYTRKDVTAQFNKDMPNIAIFPILKSNGVRKVVALLLWIVGAGIFTAIAMAISGAVKKTKQFEADMLVFNRTKNDNVNANLASTASKSYDAVSAILGMNTPHAVGHVVQLPASGAFLATLTGRRANAISIPELEKLGDLAFNTYANLEKRALVANYGTPPLSAQEESDTDAATQAFQSAPFNSAQTLINIAGSMHQVSMDTTLTQAQKSFYAEITSKLLYTCEILKNSPTFDPVTDGLTIGRLETSLKETLHRFSLGLTIGNVNFHQASYNQAHFRNQICNAGDANGSCGSIAIAALLGSPNPISDGFQMHRSLKTRATDTITDYTSDADLDTLAGVNIRQSIPEDPINKALPLVERYNIILSKINPGQDGLLQVGGLFLMCRKYPNGSIEIYDSHGSGTKQTAAYFARFTDDKAASIFLAANRRPAFNVPANNNIEFQLVTFNAGTTSGSVVNAANNYYQIQTGQRATIPPAGGPPTQRYIPGAPPPAPPLVARPAGGRPGRPIVPPRPRPSRHVDL